MSQDAIIHELRAIVGENYLLLERKNLIVYKQDGSIFQNAGDRRRVAAALDIPADAKERLGTLKALATV